MKSTVLLVTILTRYSLPNEWKCGLLKHWSIILCQYGVFIIEGVITQHQYPDFFYVLCIWDKVFKNGSGKFVEDSLNNFTWSIFEYLVPYFIYYECGVLGDLIPFVQFKKREKQPWRSVTFRFNKSNTPPRVFFTF